MSLAEQFARAGLPLRLVEFDRAIALLLNQGGTIDEAQQRLDLARERMSGAAMGAMPKGHSSHAAFRQPVEDGEANLNAPQGLHQSAAPSSPHRAPEAIFGMPKGHRVAAIPAREPSQTQRDAAAHVAKIMALTVLDSYKIDGRAIGDWTVSEARAAGKLKAREGYILIEAARHVANAQGNELLRAIIKPAEMQRIIQRAAEAADAV
jgi:hypothetical protein